MHGSKGIAWVKIYSEMRKSYRKVSEISERKVYKDPFWKGKGVCNPLWKRQLDQSNKGLKNKNKKCEKFSKLCKRNYELIAMV